MALAPRPHPRKPKKPMWFGPVRQCKAYVSFHLTRLYGNAVMHAQVTPRFWKRMQVKTCFDFNAVDPGRFAELETLTRACAHVFTEPMRL